MTQENYRKATGLLKECFGKKQNLTNAYMESLSKIHGPSSDTKNLREFHDICEANIRGLETLGVMTDSYGSLLIPILLKKIQRTYTAKYSAQILQQIAPWIG